MELQIPRTFSSRKRDYERLGMTVPAVFLLYDTSQIVLDGFLHHIFQRNLVLCGDALAIIVFGRIDDCKRSEEHTSELQSRPHLVCRLLLEKKNRQYIACVRQCVSNELSPETELQMLILTHIS